jgi:hypothetical protein
MTIHSLPFRRIFRRATCTALFLFLAFSAAIAEEAADSDFGYSLDFPEGFSIADRTDDSMSYLFSHDRMPVHLILKLYNNTIYADSGNALTGALSKLSAASESCDTFLWRDVSCTIARFSMSPGKSYKGWALAVPLTTKKAELVLLCYADAEKENDCEQFILSVLNSLAIDRASYFSPGPVTTYAFPKAGVQPITLTINGKTIQTEIDKNDAEASRFVIDCEYAVLTLYANNASWKEAWQRYYRAIFRDNYARLRKCSLDIYTAIAPSVKDDPHPDAALVQALLSWTQGFPYKRGTGKSADFTSLTDCLTGTGNDCDARSMLLCVLIENMGTKTALFVSHEYSHAVFGAVLAVPGAKIHEGNTDFLLCETTAPVKIGLMAQDMSDTSKWIPVLLP